MKKSFFLFSLLGTMLFSNLLFALDGSQVEKLAKEKKAEEIIQLFHDQEAISLQEARSFLENLKEIVELKLEAMGATIPWSVLENACKFVLTETNVPFKEKAEKVIHAILDPYLEGDEKEFDGKAKKMSSYDEIPTSLIIGATEMITGFILSPLYLEVTEEIVLDGLEIFSDQ